jgi:ABC-type sugar transport system ATPase subunit
MSKHGRTEQAGALLEIYCKPANKFTAGFIGTHMTNFLVGAQAILYHAAAIDVCLECLRIDPDRLSNGVTRTIEYFGNEVVTHVHLSDGTLLTVR